MTSIGRFIARGAPGSNWWVQGPISELSVGRKQDVHSVGVPAGFGAGEGPAQGVGVGGVPAPVGVRPWGQGMDAAMPRSRQVMVSRVRLSGIARSLRV